MEEEWVPRYPGRERPPVPPSEPPNCGSGTGLQRAHNTPMASGHGPASLACDHQQALSNRPWSESQGPLTCPQIHLLSAVHAPLLGPVSSSQHSVPS